jgi:hypothetical protein
LPKIVLFAAPRCIRTSHRQKESKSAASGAVEHLPMVATIGIALDPCRAAEFGQIPQRI